MKSEWEVTYQYIGDEKIYQVYRLRSISEINHVGNREYAGKVLSNEAEALSLAAELNEKEESS